MAPPTRRDAPQVTSTVLALRLPFAISVVEVQRTRFSMAVSNTWTWRMTSKEGSRCGSRSLNRKAYAARAPGGEVTGDRVSRANFGHLPLTWLRCACCSRILFRRHHNGVGGGWRGHFDHDRIGLHGRAPGHRLQAFGRKDSDDRNRRRLAGMK